MFRLINVCTAYVRKEMERHVYHSMYQAACFGEFRSYSTCIRHIHSYSTTPRVSPNAACVHDVIVPSVCEHTIDCTQAIVTFMNLWPLHATTRTNSLHSVPPETLHVIDYKTT